LKFNINYIFTSFVFTQNIFCFYSKDIPLRVSHAVSHFSSKHFNPLTGIIIYYTGRARRLHPRLPDNCQLASWVHLRLPVKGLRVLSQS